MHPQTLTLDADAEFGLEPIEVAPRLWWVGSRIEGDPFQCHVYLLEQGDQSVLFDPGSVLTWSDTLEKIEKIISFDDIRWFVVHHQDPDVCGAMPEIDAMITRDDARWVTHWRVAVLLKHYDPKVPFWLVDEHDWKLDLGARALEFIFTPYLHFPGAFVSFDKATGTLLSSDLFGGFTGDNRIFSAGMVDFEGVRAFHEHYMPDRDILLNAMLKLEKRPIEMIAPQHGKLIRDDDVTTYITRLKNLDCGLYLLAKTDTDIRHLQALNRLLREAVETMATERDFRVIIGHIFEEIGEVMPMKSTDIVCRMSDDAALWLSSLDRFRGTDIKLPAGIRGLTVDAEGWTEGIANDVTSVGFPVEVGENDSVLPLFSAERAEFLGVAILRVADDFKTSAELDDALHRISQPISIAIERELVNRMLDSERNAMYERSIRDPLTNLYTRRYLDESAARLIEVHQRNEDAGFALLMVDIDHFKAVNDTHGHVVGDEILVAVGGVLLEMCRKADFAVRFGGEEFAVLMPLTSRDDAAELGERLRSSIEDLHTDTTDGTVDVTISIGVASHCPAEPLADTIKKADMALYRAKETGRNKVCIDPGCGDSGP